MARTVTLLGVNYSVPESNESGYDQALTNYLVALATAFPQLNGTNSALTAEIDFGASFGLKSLYYKSRTANPAAAGQVRLASADAINFRNAANAADVALAKDSADQLTWGGAYVTGNPMLEATTAAGQTIANGATSIVVFGTIVTDSDSAYNAGTGRYTVPTGKGGDYLISAMVQFNSTQAGAIGVQAFKGGSIYRSLGGAATQVQNEIRGGSCVARVVAGDILDVRVQNTGAGGQTLTATATGNWLSIKRITT